ncbi:MAG: hypothetical protein IKE91_04955 [Clostridia bacterium]|nr:hypothetical protein [Clostridia bacterium]
MGKPINVTPNVHEAAALRYAFNSSSSHHYCFNGASRDHCFSVAWEMAEAKQAANRKDGCNKWPVIDIAVVPHPNMPGMYMIEDRSEWTR